MNILFAALSLGILGLIFGVLLGFASAALMSIAFLGFQGLIH